MKKIYLKFPMLLLALVVGLLAAPHTYAGATIVIKNNDPSGVGFNDNTPADPIGGNTGTTLGQQRLKAFEEAARIWGASLNSNVTITVDARMVEQDCTANSGTLGSAGATTIRANFANAPFPDTWYGAALANAIAGADSSVNAEIQARFNVKLGTPGCLENSGWYLGLDGNHGNKVDMVAVLLHEFGHGLGFQTFTSKTTGKQAEGTNSQGETLSFPTIYDRFLKDNTANKLWPAMTDAERLTSITNTKNVAWVGPQVKADAPNVLGTPRLKLGPLGNFDVGTAEFGSAVSATGTSGQIVDAFDAVEATGTANDGCSAINNAGAVSGKIALVDRGGCNFIVKAKNAQVAGAIGLIVVDISGATTPQGMSGGEDPTITLPAVFVTAATGATLRSNLGASVTLFLDSSTMPGTDGAGHPLLFTPNPMQSGSSISHWDTTTSPNQLMEPNNSSDLAHSVVPSRDLTLSLMKDIGWSTNLSTTPAPTPTPTPTPVPTPTPTPTPAGDTIAIAGASTPFNEATVNTAQGYGVITVQVSRSNAGAGAATVQYTTEDGAGGSDCNVFAGHASQRCDYVTAAGTLRFAPGEATKTIQIPVVPDGYGIEGNESFIIKLFNPAGATLGATTQATLTIQDRGVSTTAAQNPYIDNSFFVRQLYLDILGREPDAGGFATWTGVLNTCGPEKGFLGALNTCNRQFVSHGFVASPEFTDRGYRIHRLYEVGARRLPRYAEFVPEMAGLSGAPGSAELEQNTAQYAENFVTKPEFTANYGSVSTTAQAAQFIALLEQNAGVTLPATTTTLPGQPPQYNRQDLINLRANGTFTVGQTLRAFVEQKVVYDRYFERGFVTMMYFGFLRRDADLNDAALAGWTEWVFVFTNGGAQRGRPDIGPRDIQHLIFGFIYSEEYRKRFGQP